MARMIGHPESLYFQQRQPSPLSGMRATRALFRESRASHRLAHHQVEGGSLQCLRRQQRPAHESMLVAGLGVEGISFLFLSFCGLSLADMFSFSLFLFSFHHCMRVSVFIFAASLLNAFSLCFFIFFSFSQVCLAWILLHCG